MVGQYQQVKETKQPLESELQPIDLKLKYCRNPSLQDEWVSAPFKLHMKPINYNSMKLQYLCWGLLENFVQNLYCLLDQ